jgi:putative transposase
LFTAFKERSIRADPGGAGSCGRRLLQLVLRAKQAGRGCFERLKHAWVDAGYQGKEWLAWIETALWTVEIVRKPRPCPPSRCSNAALVVERTFAWLDTYRRLSTGYEYLPESSEAMVQLAMINLMAHRLTPG